MTALTNDMKDFFKNDLAYIATVDEQGTQTLDLR